MRNIYVLYHANCLDGFCAAWAAWKKLGDDGVRYIPVQYGEDIQIDEGADLYLLDFTFPRGVTEGLIARCRQVTILDHHATAERDLQGLEGEKVKIVFDMAKSGGRLAWEHFHPQALVPWLVAYTEDRDLGRIFQGTSTLPQSAAINACLRSYPLEFDFWNGLEKTAAMDHFLQGMGILRGQQAMIDQHIRRVRFVEIADHRVPIVNATVLQSEIGAALAALHPFSVTYMHAGDRIIFSLRSRADGQDVSEIAKRYGGGGHRNAAGFTVQKSGDEAHLAMELAYNEKLVATLMQQVTSLTPLPLPEA